MMWTSKLSLLSVYLMSPADSLLLDGGLHNSSLKIFNQPLFVAFSNQFITFARANLYDMIFIKESSAQY